MERVDRIRARIAYLRDAHAVQKAERLTPADLDWFTSVNGISPEEALARHEAASAFRCKQIEAVILQLERELAELTAPKPITQPKPRKK
jgi:hypothetical protein